MREASSPSASDYYAKVGLEYFLDYRRFDDVYRVLTKTTDGGRNAWYERRVTQDQLQLYQNDINDVIRHLKQHILSTWDTEELGEQLGLLSLCYLITASLASLGHRMPANLIIEAVHAGYRSPDWGLETAQLIGDEDERLGVRVTLAEHLPEDKKLNILKELLGQVAGLRVGVWAIDYLASHLPESWRPRLREVIATLPDDVHGHRPRGLVALATQSPKPTRSELIEESLTAARAIRNTRGHALTLLMLIPLVSKEKQDDLWDEFIEAFKEMALGRPEPPFLNNWYDLAAKVAAFERLNPSWLINLLNAFVDDSDRAKFDSFSQRDRDKILGLYTYSLLKNKRLYDALQAYQAMSHEDIRVETLVDMLEYLEPHWLPILLLPLKGAPFRQQLRRRLLVTGWVKMSPAEQTEVYSKILAMVRTLTDPDALRRVLYRLLSHLPDNLAEDVFQDLLDSVNGITDPKDRAAWLASLAARAPVAQRESLFQQAFALVKIGDETERSALHNACTALLDKREPAREEIEDEETEYIEWDRDALLALLDLKHGQAVARLRQNVGHLPPHLLPLAWEVTWSLGHDNPDILTRLCVRMIELGEIEAAHDYLRELVMGWPNGSISRFLEGLPSTLLTPRVFGYVMDRMAAAQEAQPIWVMLSTISEMADRLPDAVVHEIINWFRSRPMEYGDYTENIMAYLTPLYARVGYLDEALALTTAISAHDEKAEALVSLAHYVEEPECSRCLQDALDLMSVPRLEKVWSGWMRNFMQAFGPSAGATGKWSASIIDASKDVDLLCQIACLWPEDKAWPVWREAVLNTSGDGLAPYIPQMPIDVVCLALRWPAARGTWSSQPALLPALFERIKGLGPRRQFEELCDYLEASLEIGRPRLLADLAALAPVLHELGGDETLVRLQEAVELVARWWE